MDEPTLAAVHSLAPRRNISTVPSTLKTIAEALLVLMGAAKAPGQTNQMASTKAATPGKVSCFAEMFMMRTSSNKASGKDAYNEHGERIKPLIMTVFKKKRFDRNSFRSPPP
jgi:hypothetical protein